MTDENQNPQVSDLQADAIALLEPPSGGRVHFGRLTIYAKKVRLESGAEGYSIEGLTDFNGLPVQFKGKVPDEKSRTVHVVPVLTKADKDGNDFTVNQNLLSSSREYKRVFLVSLKAKVPNYATIVNTGAIVFVRLEETAFADFYPVGADDAKLSYIDREGDQKDRTVWKVTEHYPTPAAMKAASDEFFAQFQDGEEGASGSDGGLGSSPGSYNEQGWAGMTEGIKTAFEGGGNAVTLATEYAFLEDAKAAAASGHSAPEIAAAWSLPIPLIAQVIGS